VLRYLGRYAEALDATDIAARAYAQAAVAAYSLALVDYLRAVIFVETERRDEALRLARKCARVFRQFGEDDRFVHAKIVEASVLFDRNRYRDARDLFVSLVGVAKGLGDAATLARLYGNVQQDAVPEPQPLLRSHRRRVERQFVRELDRERLIDEHSQGQQQPPSQARAPRLPGPASPRETTRETSRADPLLRDSRTGCRPEPASRRTRACRS
jgi:tetratricopeptide (TPR) repeat protein